MAIEKITPSQEATAVAAKVESDGSLAQKVAFDADDAARKAAEAADIAKQLASKVPDALIAGLQTSIEAMLAVLSGYQNPKNPTFNPYPLITTIIASLNAVIAQLATISAPSIPGLAKVNALLATLAIAAKANDNSANVPGNNPELSPEIMNTVQDLLIATQSLCNVIPLVILKVVFDMLNDVIMCFRQIMPHNYGLPIIPSPLVKAPICSATMPSIASFVTTFNSQMSNAAYGVLRKAAKSVQDTQFPIHPPDVLEVASLAAAPGRDAPASV